MHRSVPWFGLSAVIAVADQATKLAAVDGLRLHERVEILPFFNLTLVHNPGAAFSFLATAGGWQRTFFVVLTLAISAVIVAWLARSGSRHTGTATALSLVLGGAIGNLIDRVRLGYVIDFLDLHVAGWHWPAFNIADAAIVCGAGLLAWLALTGRDGG
jgi:signal peptidase II